MHYHIKQANETEYPDVWSILITELRLPYIVQVLITPQLYLIIKYCQLTEKILAIFTNFQFSSQISLLFQYETYFFKCQLNFWIKLQASSTNLSFISKARNRELLY